MATCPHCGRKVELKKSGSDYYSGSTYGLFENTVKLRNAAVAVEPVNSIRETPAHLPTREAHVTVPLQQAVISGVLLAPVGGAIAALICYHGLEFTVVGSLVVGFGGGSFATFWVSALWQWSSRVTGYNNLLWHIEEITGLDLNRDGDVGQPEPQTMRIEMRHQNTGRWQFAEIPVAPAKLRELARNIQRGDSFAERTGTDAGLTQEEFRVMRDIFIDRGWAQWNHPTRRQQGASLTRGGMFVIRQIAGSSVPAEVDLSEKYEII